MNNKKQSEIVVRHKSELPVNQNILSQMDCLYELFQQFNIHIAGGIVLKAYQNQEPDSSDFDLFVDSDETYNCIVDYIINHSGVKIVETLNANTLSVSCYDLLRDPKNPPNYEEVTEAWQLDELSIQVIIKQKFEFFHEVFAHFDIETCKIGYWNDHFIMTRRAEYLIKNQYLEITKSIYDGAMKQSRIIKYMNRGFAPTSKLFEELFTLDLLEQGYTLNSDHMGGHDDYNNF